jgi:protein ImuA
MTTPLPHGRPRAEVVEELRRLLPWPESLPAEARGLSFDLPAIDRCLPQGGLAFGAMHEIVPASKADKAAAFGFISALLGRLPPGAPVLIVAASSQMANGYLHGHGFNSLGLDPARLILVEAGDDRQTLWALEEALRARALAAVVGSLGARLDLLAGQRLHLAAGDSGLPLFLLRPPGLPGANVAMTRWRIAATASRRDRFGLLAQWRWQVRLERCRNGRSGEWVLEYDHAAYRFSLSAAMADPALSRRAST